MAKTWINYKGLEVPEAYVPKYDKAVQKVVEKAIKQAEDYQVKLEVFKTDLLNDADKLYAQMLKENNIEQKERKGNFTMTSFDKTLKIEISIQERIEFDDKIILAQEKLNEYIAKKMKNSDADLALLISSAFTTSKGKLDNKRIFSLFAIPIKDPLWIEAIDLIKNSIKVNNKARYIQFFKKTEKGEYKPININFSNI